MANSVFKYIIKFILELIIFAIIFILTQFSFFGVIGESLKISTIYLNNYQIIFGVFIIYFVLKEIILFIYNKKPNNMAESNEEEKTLKNKKMLIMSLVITVVLAIIIAIAIPTFKSYIFDKI